MDDPQELDRDTRRGLRILAASTKNASDRAAKRLERAADSGSKADYLEAEAMFNSLPPESRSEISSGAENRARIVKAKIVEQKMASTKVRAPGAGAMTWDLGMPKTKSSKKAEPEDDKRKRVKPATLPQIAGQVSWELNKIPPGAPPRREAKKDDDPEDGKNWDWRKLPEDPVMRSARRKNSVEIVDEYELLRREIFGEKG